MIIYCSILVPIYSYLINQRVFAFCYYPPPHVFCINIVHDYHPMCFVEGPNNSAYTDGRQYKSENLTGRTRRADPSRLLQVFSCDICPM